MADKAKDSEFLFGSGAEGVDPFPITGETVSYTHLTLPTIQEV